MGFALYNGHLTWMRTTALWGFGTPPHLDGVVVGVVWLSSGQRSTTLVVRVPSLFFSFHEHIFIFFARGFHRWCFAGVPFLHRRTAASLEGSLPVTLFLSLSLSLSLSRSISLSLSVSVCFHVSNCCYTQNWLYPKLWLSLLYPKLLLWLSLLYPKLLLLYFAAIFHCSLLLFEFVIPKIAS